MLSAAKAAAPNVEVIDLLSESSESDSSEADDFVERDSDISDEGESEPEDGESLGSQDSERSEDSEAASDTDESIVYETEQEDELDRLDARAEEIEQMRASKRRRIK